MNIDRLVFAMMGTVILLSVVLTKYVHPDFFWLTIAVGAVAFQSAFTGFCPSALVFKKLGAKEGCAFK